MKISICIPTYNRAVHLTNCLQSIISNKSKSEIEFQVCVSDNCSTDETEDVVRRAQNHLDIKYYKNESNLGVTKNILNVVGVADGEFIWLIGDDDLLLPFALEKISNLICKYKDIDYFYINTFHLESEYVLSFPQPFDTANLPKDMKLWSSWPKSGEMKFMDLVDPKISFDFLGGMFLSVFRRRKWIRHVDVLEKTAVSDPRVCAHFDNTYPHVKIFANAFANSAVFFNAEPLSVCLRGAREWAPMFPLVRSVRTLEALNEYRKNGLPYIKYLLCKNYALNHFVPDFVLMLINKDHSGFVYIKPWKLIFGNCLYPNFYFSIFYSIGRKLKLFFNLFNRKIQSRIRLEVNKND